MKVPIEINARHIHLTKDVYIKLFGNDVMSKLKDVSQPNQFAAKETVSVKNNDQIIGNVRIVGPFREYNQIEISKTDAYHLKINSPIRTSGDLDNTPGIKLIGPKNEIDLTSGVIINRRHLHISLEEAKEFNIKDGDIISVKIDGNRSVTFHNVIVRSHDKIDSLAFQIDTDEANAAGVSTGDFGEII